METIYVAKYALTSGIKKIQAEVRHSSYADSKEYAREPGGYNSFTIGSEAFRSLDEAKEKAEEMRKKKIKSLEKQLEKLNNLRF